MKKLFLFFAALLGVLSFSYGQCDRNVIQGAQRYVHDTTYVQLTIDTAYYGTTGYSYSWTFADGSIHTGMSVEYPVTGSLFYPAGSIYHYTVTGPGCSTADAEGYVFADFVLSCSELQAPWFSQYSPTTQTGPTPNDVRVSFEELGYWGPRLKVNIQLDWGNGHSVSYSQGTDTFYTTGNGIGGITDPSHSSGYLYAGRYIVGGTVFFSFDTLTCPVLPLTPICIDAGGVAAVPVIHGATTYCAGDSIRLYATDTTAQFHNLYHNVHSSGIYYYPWNFNSWDDYWYPQPNNTGGTALAYEWYDMNYNLLAMDTFLTVMAKDPDSGNYILRVYDKITGIDTQTTVHITINGTRISLDSIVAPTCTVAGSIALNCYRLNDSVTVSYKKDGLSQTYSGRTDAAGHITVPGIVEGSYSDVQVFVAGLICGSNILSGPYTFHSAIYPLALSGISRSTCVGGTVTLSAVSIPAASYFWSGPNGFASSLQNPVLTGLTTAAAGSYKVAVVVGGCASDTGIVAVSVQTAVPNLASAHFADNVCPNDYFDLQGYSSSNVYVTVTSSDTSVIHDFQSATRARAAGVTVLTATAVNGCGSSSFSQTVHVKRAPALPAIAAPNHACIGDTVTVSIASSGGSWSADGPRLSSSDHIFTFIAGANNLYGADISYTKDSGGCSTVSRTKVVVGRPYINQYSKGLYPGDSITLTTSYPFTSGYWTAMADTIATVYSTGMVKAGTRVGSTSISYLQFAECGIAEADELYVSDWIDSRIAGGGLTTLIASRQINATDMYLSEPRDVAKDSMGNVYVLDRALYKVDRNGIITTVAGVEPDAYVDPYSGYSNYSGDGGYAKEAFLAAPNHMACDKAGNIYISCHDNGVIRKIGTNGIITRFAGVLGNPYYWPSNGYSGDGGPATAAHINAGYMAIDNNGNLYFSEYENHRIRKIDASGIITTIAGTGVNGFTGDGGAATSARIGQPQGLAIDTAGNIIVSTLGRLRKIDQSGNITTIAGIAGGAAIAGQPATATALVFDGSIACDKQGSIYISNSQVIRKIDRNGMLSTLAGNGRWQYTVPDVGPSAHTNSFSSLVADDSGGVYATYGGTVRHEGKPTIEIHASQDTLCAGTGTVTFNAQSHYTGNNPTYQWKKNGAVVGSSSYTFTDPAYSAGDTISCSVSIASVAQPVARASRTVAVYTTALSAGTITGTPTVCAAGVTTLANTTPGGTWASSTAAATVAGGIVTGVNAGTAIISYTVANSCGTATDTMEVTVNPLPNAGTVTGIPTVCEAATTTLTNTITGGTWSTNAPASTVTGGIVTGVNAGTAIISYTVANSCGTATDTMEVTVSALPNAGTITGTPTVCEAATTTLSSTITGGTWTSSSTAAAVAGGVLTGVTAGTAIISYSVTNTCGTATDTMQVTVNALPLSGVISGADSVCEGNAIMLAESAIGGTWTTSNASVGTITGMGSFTGISTGTVVVGYSVTNSCGTSAASHTMYVQPAADCSAGLTTTFNIFPNPSDGSFTVEVPSPGTNVLITVMDITSRVIQTVQPKGKELFVPVYMSNMPSGTYIVKLEANGRMYTGKVVMR